MVITIKGQPIPAKRVTRRMLWRAKDYADYKEFVAWQLKRVKIKPIVDDCHIKRISFFRKGNRRADLDNLLKSIMEAFEMSGVVKNDRQIVSIKNLEMTHNSKNPRVEIEL